MLKPLDAPSERDLADEVGAVAEEARSGFGTIELMRQQQRQEAGMAGNSPQPSFNECLCQLAPLPERRIRNDPVRQARKFWLPGQKVENFVLPGIAVIKNIGRVDTRAAGKLESLGHASVAAGALPHGQILEIDVLGQGRDHPGRRRVEIARDSCVAGLVLAHGLR